MPRRHRILASLVIAVVVLGVATVSWQRAMPTTAAAENKRSGGDRAIPVRVAPVRQGQLEVAVSALGTVTARNTAVVRARVDGLLQQIKFREGDWVKAGQTLAEIDPRPFQAAVDQVRGQLARDQAQLSNAQVDLERYRGLLKQDSIAKQQVDDQAAQVRQLQGTVQLDRAQLESAELQLSFTRVVAPIPGRLGLRQIDAGNQVHASDANGIVTITETQPISAVFAVPAEHLPRILERLRRGDRPAVNVFDRDGKTLLATGPLASVDNQIDPATGTIKLKAEFPNTDQRLFPNQFVNIRLIVDVLRGATLIPAAAVQRGASGTFVYVARSGEDGAKLQTSLRPVKLGPADGDTVAITEGLKPDEQVVIDGADKLRDGMAVEIPGAAPAPGTEGASPPNASDGGQQRRWRKNDANSAGSTPKP